MTYLFINVNINFSYGYVRIYCNGYICKNKDYKFLLEKLEKYNILLKLYRPIYYITTYYIKSYLLSDKSFS